MNPPQCIKINTIQYANLYVFSPLSYLIHCLVEPFSVTWIFLIFCKEMTTTKISSCNCPSTSSLHTSTLSLTHITSHHPTLFLCYYACTSHTISVECRTEKEEKKKKKEEEKDKTLHTTLPSPQKDKRWLFFFS